MKFIISLVALCATLNSLQSQVVINEYSASNLSSYLDNYSKTEDWIELYNPTDTEIDISGYHLSDKENKETKWEIPAGTLIPENGYLVFWCSGRDESFDGNYHTNFKLAQTSGKDIVLLSDPDGNILEMTEMELTLVEHSRCKESDGTGAWKVCIEPTLGASNNDAEMFDTYTDTPTMDIEAGFYTDSVIVTITNNQAGSTLRYTLDGNNPTIESPMYTEPIKIKETTVVKAMSFTNDPTILTGKMDFNTYFIGENDFSVAVYSVAANQVIDLANGDGEIIPIGSIEYFAEGSSKREAASFGSLNRHGQDSWVLPHRSLDWVSRDEMGYSKALNAPLFSYSDRDQYQKFMFRNSGDDNYPAIDDDEHSGSTHIRDEYVQTLVLEGDMELDQRAVERVVLFLNGEYWGLYGLRERPVDHDYTKEYYDQGKYNNHFLTTWSDTEIQYGGQEAVDDWTQLRDFILDNDMSVDTNYDKAKDQLNTKSLIDYMLMNLNTVAVDWLNYNTGWWRGTDPEGEHKKWGYIAWDMDATFDFYINYTGVPNPNPDALPCDIEAISESMDQFWGTGGPGSDTIVVVADCPTVLNGSTPHSADDPILSLTMNIDPSCCYNGWTSDCEALYQALQDSALDPDSCLTITNGSSPYSADDPFFIEVINFDGFCCTSEWDGVCQSLYDAISGGGGPGGEGNIQGNFGKHEKIFLKLIEESPRFKRQYYSRQADLMNTVFSCENMMTTLDRMLDVIRPEMPRQIDRWGGTMVEWESNVQRLKDFIAERCEFFGEGMTSCYDLTGPFQITLMTEPVGVGDDIEFNSLKIEEFPWTGSYFGNMENKIKADKKDGDYKFSHWRSTSGQLITPNELERKATINLAGPDTLVAVYKLISVTDDLSLSQSINVYPNPTRDVVNLLIDMDYNTAIHIDMYTAMGKYVGNIVDNDHLSEGTNSIAIDMSHYTLSSGVYTLRIRIDDQLVSKKISFLK